MNTYDGQEKVVRAFMAGDISLDAAQRKLGKSRATVYRWAGTVKRGEKIEDKRKYGNHRKYGK